MKRVLVGAALIWILVLGYMVYANPTGPQTVEAYAGNVTQLTIFGEADSANWVGYYGNITGAITLDNGDNWTLYQWGGTVNPQGEMYAANESVSNWAGVKCVNLSTNNSGFNCNGENEQCLNVSEIETGFGMGADDADGVDETFNQTISAIEVGSVTLNDCPMTNLFSNSTAPIEQVWNQTIITINDTDTIIFASVINHNTLGFDNTTMDFQMMLGEDGSDSVATTYYIYTELS